MVSNPDFLHYAGPLENGTVVFQDHINVCRTGKAVYDRPEYILDEAFEKEFCALAGEGPETFHAFFDRFGTVILIYALKMQCWPIHISKQA